MLNVHAYNFGDEDINKQAIYHPCPHCQGDLHCILGTVPHPNLAVNNKPISVCMFLVVVHNLYVSHAEELLHIESTTTTTLLGFLVLSSCQS